MISSNLHLKFETKQIQDGGSFTVRTFKERFLRFQLSFQDFYHFHHVIWGMKWAKKIKTKNGQNMSSGPFSHDAAIYIPLQAQFFGKIQQNGYKVLYLSARAIGQVRLTLLFEEVTGNATQFNHHLTNQRLGCNEITPSCRRNRRVTI